MKVARGVVRQLLSALAAIHALGVVHRRAQSAQNRAYCTPVLRDNGFASLSAQHTRSGAVFHSLSVSHF